MSYKKGFFIIALINALIFCTFWISGICVSDSPGECLTFTQNTAVHLFIFVIWVITMLWAAIFCVFISSPVLFFVDMILPKSDNFASLFFPIYIISTAIFFVVFVLIKWLFRVKIKR